MRSNPCDVLKKLPRIKIFKMALPSVLSESSRREIKEIKSVLVICNPQAGRGRGAKWVQESLPSLAQARDIQHTVILTERAGHAEEILASAPDLEAMYDLVVIVGGDGSIHESVNGLLKRTQQPHQLPLGVIPAGTGNALLTDLELSTLTFNQVFIRLIKGRCHWMDVGRLTYKDGSSLYFFNIVHYGLPVDVNVSADRNKWAGGQRYNVGSIIEIIRGQYVRHAHLEIDGTPFHPNFANAKDPSKPQHYPVSLFMCQNTVHTGKNMKAAPRNKLDDGLLDLVISAKSLDRLTLVRLFGTIFDGTHVERTDLADYIQFKKLTLCPVEVDNVGNWIRCCCGLSPTPTTSTAQALPGSSDKITVDGEITGAVPFTIEVIPAAISICL